MTLTTFPIASSSPASTQRAILRAQNLHVLFSLNGQKLEAVRGITFEVFEGESVGIVGESGCGKSAAVQALVGLNPAAHVEGLIERQGTLGKDIGMVFQDPMTYLNPTMKIGAQIEEGILYHKLANRREAKERAIELMRLVGIPEPTLRYQQYPHHLSGGQRQRVLIAIALACRPKLLIADEPTTALDAAIQSQVLDLIRSLQRELGMSLILITHDLEVVAKACDRVLVMYAGKIVEQGTVRQILHNPRHPYTQMLLEARPKPGQTAPLRVIEGSPPQLGDMPPGCAFAPRCPLATALCNEPPPFFGQAACWRSPDA